MPQFISPTSSSKRKASRSPDTRPSKRPMPSTPEEGEVDDGGPSNPPPPHFSLPAKPVLSTDVNVRKGKIAFPFKTKKTQVETTAVNVFSEPRSSAGKASPGRGRTHERPIEGKRHSSRDSDIKERRNGRGSRAGDSYYPDNDGSRYPSRIRSRSRSRSRSMSPGMHRLPRRDSSYGHDRHDRRDRGDRFNNWRDRDERGYDRDHRGRYMDDEDRYYRPQPYSSSRWSDDRDRGGRDFYHRRHSPSRTRHERSYRPRSPPPVDHARTPPGQPDDFARTPPGQPDLAKTPPGSPPPHSPPNLPEAPTHPPPAFSPPSAPLPPLHEPPPPPPRTPPPIPPPDTRLSYLDKPQPTDPPPKPKAFYIPMQTTQPLRPPPAPRDTHSPPPLKDPAATDRFNHSTAEGRDHRKNNQKEPPRIRIVRRRVNFTPDRKEEERRFGHVLEGCGRQDDYAATTKLGEGTFGEVHKAVHKTTGRVVALKRILMHNEKEGMPVTALREIKILKAMKHVCVIEILDMFIVRSTETEPMSVFMVFPYMDHDLAGLLENERVVLQPSHIKLYMKQLLEGTAYMHRNHILHRDMKAANLLISNSGSLRIADFGLARSYELEPASNSGKERKYTNCVVTRWYRPPELLMGARNYGGEVDIWGIGCVFGEMFLRRPILPGTSDIDQLEKIWQLCGTPNQHTWPHHDRLPGCEGITRWKNYPRKIKQAYEAISSEVCDLMDKLLTCNPNFRISAETALDHDYFWTDPLPADPKTLPSYEASHEFDKRSQRAMNRPPPQPPIPQHPRMDHRHEPQHRAMAIPHHNARPPAPPNGWPQPNKPINHPGMPQPPPMPGNGYYPPNFPPQARPPPGPPGGVNNFPSRAAMPRNGPYQPNGSRHYNGPPRVHKNSAPPSLPVAAGLPVRPMDPQGRVAGLPSHPPTRGGDPDRDISDPSASLNYG